MGDLFVAGQTTTTDLLVNGTAHIDHLMLDHLTITDLNVSGTANFYGFVDM